MFCTMVTNNKTVNEFKSLSVSLVVAKDTSILTSSKANDFKQLFKHFKCLFEQMINGYVLHKR